MFLISRGIWNVPFISQAYLINATLLKKTNDDNSGKSSFSPTYFITNKPEIDPEMAFCKSLRDAGKYMFVDNMNDYGHLVTSETYNISASVHPDMFEIYSNQKDWTKKYIHENYSRVLSPDYQLEQPCPDVYWFPLVSPMFCRDLVEIMETFGKWSEGKNTVIIFFD